ncbi:MAG: hypothetical protein JXP34_19780 [Planctomycetes bacterium]|nr:hypothetical protein [Planctomycetota bacterium]
MYIDGHCHVLITKGIPFDPRVIDEYAAFAQHYPDFAEDAFTRPPRIDALGITEHVHAPAYEEIIDFLDGSMERRAPGVYLYRDVFFISGAEVGVRERAGDVDYFGDALVLAPPEVLIRLRDEVRARAAECPPIALPDGRRKRHTMLAIDEIRAILGRDGGAEPPEGAPTTLFGAAHLFRRKIPGRHRLADLPPDRLRRFDYIETNGRECEGHREILEACRRLRMWYLAGSDAHTTVQVGVTYHHFPPPHVNRSNLSLPTLARATASFLGDSMVDPYARFRVAYAAFHKAYLTDALDRCPAPAPPDAALPTSGGGAP